MRSTHRFAFGLFSAGWLLTIIICLTLSAACQSTGGLTVTPTPSSSSRDIERLSKYVRFPIQPTGVSWEIVPLSDPELLGPTDALLFAILTFDAPSLDSFMDQALPLNKAQDLFIKPQWVREWFSQNLKDKISVSSASGYLTINLIGYKADPFLNSSSAFSQGYYVRIDDKSLLLSLSGK